MGRRTALSFDDVRDIKAALWHGDTQRDVAKRFRVSQPTVSYIARGALHYKVPWPDDTVGAMPRWRQLQLDHDQYAARERLLNKGQEVDNRRKNPIGSVASLIPNYEQIERQAEREVREGKIDYDDPSADEEFETEEEELERLEREAQEDSDSLQERENKAIEIEEAKKDQKEKGGKNGV